jgi:hypothetical protein
MLTENRKRTIRKEQKAELAKMTDSQVEAMKEIARLMEENDLVIGTHTIDTGYGYSQGIQFLAYGNEGKYPLRGQIELYVTSAHGDELAKAANGKIFLGDK